VTFLTNSKVNPDYFQIKVKKRNHPANGRFPCWDPNLLCPDTWTMDNHYWWTGSSSNFL